MSSFEMPITIINGNCSHKQNGNNQRSSSDHHQAENEANDQSPKESFNIGEDSNKKNIEEKETCISSETLQILGQIKNIEKINEKRRIFLNNAISDVSTSVTSTETSTAITNEKTENGATKKTITKEKCEEKCETKFDCDNNNQNNKEELKKKNILRSYNEEHSTIVHESYAEKASNEHATSKYTTIQTANTLQPLKSPLTPPPKPPMLSRTRSLGIGDQRSTAVPTNAVPKTPANTPNTPPTMQSPTKTLTTDATPIVSATVTTTTLASPTKVTTELRAQEIAPIVVRRAERPMSISPDPQPKNISLNHYERLVEELKCPGCASPMKAPILLCQTGHSVCSQCTRILLMCPLCKEPFTTMRSRTVEAMCHKAHFRCCNASGGCTVRLHTDLLPWHEKQCVYKPMKCFMGRVWGDCQWSGREVFWKDHLEAEHTNRLFQSDNADLIWNMGVKQKPLTGYYVFNIYDELFNFYEIYDRDRVLFTMTCTSTVRDRKHHFAYEVTIVNPDNEALAITQKYPVHSEYDKDILAQGTCVSIPFSDLAKFIDDEKLLHYRVHLVEVKSPRKVKTPRFAAIPTSNGMHPVDFQQTQIEGVNLKGVPRESILVRKVDDFPFVDNTVTPSSNGTEIEAGAAGLGDEDVTLRHRYYGNEPAAVQGSSSESDPELEAYIAKRWGTPQLHFNRKYLKDTSIESSSSAGEAGDRLDDRMSVTSKRTSYAKKMTNSLRKSFRSIKAPIVDLKPLNFVKKSPEKKSP